MKNKLYDIRKSFVYAANGIVFCVRYEKNVRIHITAMLYVLFFSQFYELERSDLILLILVCASVIVLEMLNTAIEVVVDKVFPRYHTLAKVAKDVAAGAVLTMSLAAAAIGVVLFFSVDKFVFIFEIMTSRVSNIALFVASLVFSVIFIGSGKDRKTAISASIKEIKEDIK